MSLTPPTYFEDYYWRDGQINNTIVKLVQDGNTYYFSETDMQIGDVHVYGMLLKHSGIKEEINIMRKTWKVSSVKLTFNNLPFLVNTSGVKQRMSDILYNIRGNEAVIYLQAGKNIPTDIETNCMERFKGVVALEPAYDDEYLSLQLSDKMLFDDVEIPNRIMSSIYSDTPSEYANDVIPLVYGKFTITGDDTTDFDFSGNGLAIAIPTQIIFPPKCVVSDHVLHAITAMYLKLDGIDDPAIYDSPTLTADDSNRGTATANDTAKLYMYPSDNEDTGYDTDSYASPINSDRAYNRDTSDYAILLDSIDDGSTGTAYGTWRLSNGSKLMELFYERGIMLRIQGYLESNVGTLINEQVEFVGVNGDKSVVGPIIVDSTWQTSSGPAWTPTNLKPEEYNAITIRCQKTSWANADGIADNWSAGLMFVHGLRARLEFRPGNFTTPAENPMSAQRLNPEQPGGMLPSSNPDSPPLLITTEPLNTPAFVACEGMEYESWITGRSSNYTSGDCIEDPAGIIESLLREQLSYGNSDLDLTSFIDAENTSVKMRLNLHKGNKAPISSIIKKICEQSTFTFFMSAAGKAKLIPLNDQSPTTAAIIKHSELVKGKLKISKLSSIVETINVHSRYQQEYGGIYRDYATYTNANADGVVYNAKWPNIAGTSAQHVARHLIKKINGTDSDGDGLWANEHFQIEIETFGFLYAHLQVGDWIELDANSFDDQLKAVFTLTTSWDGQQFLITKIIQKLDSTYIRAIHLFDNI